MTLRTEAVFTGARGLQMPWLATRAELSTIKKRIGYETVRTANRLPHLHCGASCHRIRENIERERRHQRRAHYCDLFVRLGRHWRTSDGHFGVRHLARHRKSDGQQHQRLPDEKPGRQRADGWRWQGQADERRERYVRFNVLTEMGITNTTKSVITDFVGGRDKIDWSTLDANTVIHTNDVFNGALLPEAPALRQRDCKL